MCIAIGRDGPGILGNCVAVTTAGSGGTWPEEPSRPPPMTTSPLAKRYDARWCQALMWRPIRSRANTASPLDARCTLNHHPICENGGIGRHVAGGTLSPPSHDDFAPSKALRCPLAPGAHVEAHTLQSEHSITSRRTLYP